VEDDDRDAELRDALEATDTLLAEMSRLKLGVDAATAELVSAKAQLARAEREVTELRASVDPKATGAHVLGAETVASLLNDFVGSFKGRISGLEVGGGEVTLKAGFAQLGDGAGFVLPTANAPASEMPILHDIRLRLDPKG
jgi:class 3 adenylate cyclase